MKNLALLLVFAMGTPFTQPQNPSENLPTAEQCTANLHAWYPNRQADAKKLLAPELQVRIAEISACKGFAVSNLPEHKPLADDFLKFDTLMGTYEESYTLRLFHFIKRHGELARFSKEDAAGLR